MCAMSLPLFSRLLRTASVVFIVSILSIIIAKGASAQMYCPPSPYLMWDSWLFQDGDDFHLFHLQYDVEHGWNSIGRAVSKDLLHWKPLPPILTGGTDGGWDTDKGLGVLTSCTVKSGGQYFMFYGYASTGQKIGVMTSPDLVHWEKYGGNPILDIKPPYTGWAWRDMCAIYDKHDKVWHGYICSQTGSQEPKIPVIKDKTMVVWVVMDDIKQHGGGVLTLDYGPFHSDTFDSIVFGEREAGKWMIGSNISGGPRNRTQEDQSMNALESSKPGELIRIAAVFEGKSISVYHNDTLYTSYDIKEPLSFSDGTSVLMGLRNVGADRKNPDSFFSYAIEEARIYDCALTHDDIKNLRLVDTGKIKPLAQWTFEDGSTKDSMGTFPDGTLYAGAYVSDGKLILDGKGAHLNTGQEYNTPVKLPLGSIAHLTSDDLLNWKYGEPVFTGLIFSEPEVPDYFVLNGKHYFIVNCGGVIYYILGDKRDGPYTVPRNSVLLGPSAGKPSHNYVGRTIPWKKTRLFYHLTMVGKSVWAFPKIIRQNPDGTLWLQYWSDIDKLKTRTILDSVDGISEQANIPNENWQFSEGKVTGISDSKNPYVLWLPVKGVDTIIQCSMKLKADSIGEIIFRWDGVKGNAISLDSGSNTANFYTIALKDGKLSYELVDNYDENARDYQGKHISAGTQDIRILIRAYRAEVYLNDRMIFGFSIPDSPADGKIGLLVEKGTTVFTKLNVSELEPFKY